jgi:hypothetical protein
MPLLSLGLSPCTETAGRRAKPLEPLADVNVWPQCSAAGEPSSSSPRFVRQPPTTALATLVDLVDQRQVVVAAAPLDLVDADRRDAALVAMYQPPGNRVYYGPKHVSQVVIHLPGPSSENATAAPLTAAKPPTDSAEDPMN